MQASLAISHLSSTSLSPDAASSIVRLCDAAYGCPTEPMFTELGAGDHLLGSRDGNLVSHLMWVTRWLQPEGRPPLKTAYVEMVATAPAEQGRGYATMLLQNLVPHLADYELAALPVPRTPGLSLDVPLSVEWRPGEVW